MENGFRLHETAATDRLVAAHVSAIDKVAYNELTAYEKKEPQPRGRLRPVLMAYFGLPNTCHSAQIVFRASLISPTFHAVILAPNFLGAGTFSDFTQRQMVAGEHPNNPTTTGKRTNALSGMESKFVKEL